MRQSTVVVDWRVCVWKGNTTMQFTLNQNELIRALNSVKAACKKRSTLPILNTVLIQASEGLIHFTTTDLNLRITSTVTDTASIAEEGAYAANYQQLADTVKGLPKGADVAFRHKDDTLELVCSGRKFIKGLDAEEYSAWDPVHAPGETYTKMVREYEPNSSGGSTLVTNTYTYEVQSLYTQHVHVPCKLLLDMLEQTTYAAADDDSRPVFQAIFTHLQDDYLTMVAADSFRCVEHKALFPGSGSWERPVLINAKSFVQIAKLFPKNTGIEMIATSTTERLIEKNGETVFDTVPYRNDIEIRFLSETTVALLRPMEGTYPKYQNSIPEAWTTRVVCDIAELLSAYQTVWPVARDVSNISRLHIRGDKASIEAKTEEQPEPTVHEIPAATTGPDVTVILNCQYMLDFLSKTSAREVAIELTKPERPVLLQPLYQETRYMLMPMSPNR